MTASTLFPFSDPGDFRRLREELAGAGYNNVAIGELLGTGLTNVEEKKLAVVLRRASGGSPLETLVRLFVLGVAVEASAARSALPAMPPEWLAERGLVRIDGDRVEATVQLHCYQGLIVAFDFRRPGEALSPEFVMGISPSSLTLGGLTIRRPNRTALDLGTGSGFQAFLAAQHSDRVIATDKNPRAVEMARFNAALNGLDHVESRQGDLFEPLQEGEAFDLIVSNPPFVVSPETIHYFLHSGRTGDEVCRTIAQQAGRFLAPGGYCQFLANWTAVEGEDWRDRLRGWCDGTGCDAIVLRRRSQAPDEYAATWIGTEGGDDAFAPSFEAWMDYYEGLGVESIDSGLVTLRRAGRPDTWFWADDAPESMTFPAGDDLLRAFEAQDVLRAHPGDALRGARLRLSADVRLDQQARPTEGGWESIGVRLRRSAGLHWSGGIDVFGAEMLGRCDGTRPIGELLDELATTAGVHSAEDAEAWIAIVRRLTECGFLVPVAGPGTPSDDQ